VFNSVIKVRTSISDRRPRQVSAQCSTVRSSYRDDTM